MNCPAEVPIFNGEKCVACPDNNYYNPTVLRCQACPDGFYYSKENKKC
jgi:hypothetical protein